MIATAAIVAAAKINSSVFVDGFFGYESAEFQREWHRAWSAPSAQVVQWSPIESGKTQQITGFSLHYLGLDPVNARVLWIGSTIDEAKKSAGIIKRAIEQPSDFQRAVFPDLRPARGRSQKWTESEFNVEGINPLEKEHSVEVAGVGGEILGGRFNLIVLDDVCTFETTYTSDRREKFKKWFFSTVLGRLLEGGRIICVGNAWFPDDLMHALGERGFTAIRNVGYEEAENGDIIPESILWPERWSLDRLTKRREDFGGPGAVEAERQLRCVAYSAGQGRFEVGWFEASVAADLTLVDQYRGPWPTFLGVDLGVGQKEKHDKTAFFCMAVDVYGSGRKLPLAMFEGRITGPAVVAMLKDFKARYGPVAMVENNAAQEFIRQFASDAGVETLAFTTGKNKASPEFGVPSLGIELKAGQWILPTGDQRSREMVMTWRTQCLNWSPGQHTGDLLMASWFAREAARLNAYASGGATIPVATQDPGWEQPENEQIAGSAHFSERDEDGGGRERRPHAAFRFGR